MRIVKRSFSLLMKIIKFFLDEDIYVRASSLAYTTILSFIPIIVVFISILSYLPYSFDIKNVILTFLSSNLMPTYMDGIIHYINSFIDNALNVTIFGVSILLIISLLLLNKIDQTVNYIYKVRETRKLIKSILLYFFILLFIPIFLLSSFFISSTFTFIKIFGVSDIAVYFDNIILVFLPNILLFFILTVVFFVLPNSKIKFIHVCVGSFFSVVTIYALRILIEYYFINCTYDLIYGALALIPVFLLWINICWVVVLTGVKISYFLTTRIAIGNE